MRYLRFALPGLLALAALFAGSSPVLSGGGPALPDRIEKLHPKLESQLARLVEEYRSDGLAAAQEEAGLLGIDLDGQRVRVIVQAQPLRAAESAAAARVLGGRIEAAYGDLVQVLAPLGMLEALADQESVRFVRQPLRAAPAVTGEGVALINAGDWQAAGVDGSGVKVAVLDLGFLGYASLLGTELPASVVTHSCRANSDITGGGIDHGTAVAEIVHEVAPGASLYLVNFDTEVELGNCVDWLIGQGMDAINFSIGFTVSGPGDGTGVINEMVNTATSAGIFWASAAGNEADRHWSGNWSDPDSNGWHNFSGSFETSRVLLFAGEPLIVELKWDDPWDSSCNDYDLYLFDDLLNLVAFSINVQDCFSWTPTEALGIVAPFDDVYHIAIRRFAASGSSKFHLYTWPWSPEYVTSAGSILEPGDNPDVMTVGAVDWSSPNVIEPFSSQGPTSDNTTKPDIVAPDGVSNATFGSLFGTSASTAHVAGAAALVSQLLPCYTREQAQTFLEDRAVDLGTAGKDNVYGSGRLDLGAMPDQDIDQVGDACDNCPAWANAGQENNVHPGTPAGDHCEDFDDDGWSDFREDYIGSDPSDPCPDNSSHDAWHVDINRDKKVDVVDALGIGGWKEAIVAEADMLDPLYDRRLDLIMDDPNDPSVPGDGPLGPDFRADIDLIDWLGIRGYKDLYNTSCGNGSVAIDSDGDTTPELVVAEDFYPGTPAGGAGSWYDETYSLNPGWRVQMTASQADLSTISYRVTCPDADEHNFSIKWTLGAPPDELDTGGSHTVDCNDGSKVTVTIDATHQDVYSGP